MAGLIPVSEALERLLKGITPLGAESIPLAAANRRILAADLTATRTQPPFSASAMDGYAVRHADMETVPARLKVIGEAPAGHAFDGTVAPGTAVRIFTGAPVPQGADCILIQENTEREGDIVIALEQPAPGRYIRPAGLDFAEGNVLLKAGDRLDYRTLSLAAAMNHANLPVRRKPVVALLATGDELVPPGAIPGPDQIIASNHAGLAALIEDCGGEVLDLGLSPDDEKAIAEKVRQALAAKADILVTLGGASVGDHDLVQGVLGAEGMELDFWRIAMRPGKPLMAGHLGDTKVLGLPGNPVSSMVCALLFLRPLMAALLGRSNQTEEVDQALLGAPVKANDIRQDHLRAKLSRNAEGALVATPFAKQDSSLLSVLAGAEALIIRPSHAPALDAGTAVQILRL